MKSLILYTFLLLLPLFVQGQSWLPRAGNDGFTANQIGLGIPVDINADGTVRAYADYAGNTSNGSGGAVRISRWNNGSWQRMGATAGIQSSVAGEEFGRSISLSSSGSIVAIGTFGIFSNIESRSRVSVYQFNGEEWELRGTPIESDQTGLSPAGANVSISSNGNRVAFIEHLHDQNVSDGTLAGPNYGIIRIFEWTGDDWSQMGNTILGQFEGSLLGKIVSFSADGNTIAASDAGTDEVSIRLYRWDGQTWNQLGASIPSPASFFFQSFEEGDISLNGDGNVIVIGAPNNINAMGAGGQVDIYNWNGFSWERRGNTITSDIQYSSFGNSVDVSFDGRTIIVGSPFSRFTTPDDYTFRGYASVYNWNGNDHIQVGNNIRSNNNNERFGHSVSISGDGQVVNISTDFTDDNYSRVYAYDGLVSLDDGIDSNNLAFFPNPAREHIVFSVPEDGNFEVTLLDFSGRRLLREIIQFSAEQTRTLEIPNIKSGIYYVVAFDGKKYFSGKINVVH